MYLQASVSFRKPCLKYEPRNVYQFKPSSLNVTRIIIISKHISVHNCIVLRRSRTIGISDCMTQLLVILKRSVYTSIFYGAYPTWCCFEIKSREIRCLYLTPSIHRCDIYAEQMSRYPFHVANIIVGKRVLTTRQHRYSIPTVLISSRVTRSIISSIIVATNFNKHS